jgi:hypothetical protein
VKLRAHTLDGTELRIHVRLTGYLRVHPSGEIDRVEIYMPPRSCIECDKIGFDPPRMRNVMWAAPRDLCGDDGSSVSPEVLRAEASRVLEEEREFARRGPLGENWP